MFPDRVQTGEVYGRAETGAQGGRNGTAPEGGDEARGGADFGEGGAQGM